MIKKALLSSAISLSLISATAFAQNLAVVNGKPVPASRSDALVKELVSQGAQDSPQLRQNIKNQFIVEEILVQEAEKQDVASSDNVKLQMEGARRGILVNALRANYLKKNPASDAEIKAAYNNIAAQENGQQYHAKHILVKDESEARSIILQLNKGADFDKLAREKSIDPGTAARGGDLGWNKPAAYIKPFSDAMVALKKGQITPSPVQTPIGYHVIKLVETRNYTMPSLDQIKPNIKAVVEDSKWRAYVTSLVQQAKVE